MLTRQDLEESQTANTAVEEELTDTQVHTSLLATPIHITPPLLATAPGDRTGST